MSGAGCELSSHTCMHSAPVLAQSCVWYSCCMLCSRAVRRRWLGVAAQLGSKGLGMHGWVPSSSPSAPSAGTQVKCTRRASAACCMLSMLHTAQPDQRWGIS
jgi:hypothetical protein